MSKVIAVGEILVEIMTRNLGQEFLTPGELVGPFPSGAPAIFIDQAARMGVDCGIVARVGEDDFGLLNINRLQADGVDTSQILPTPGQTTGTAFITYFQDGSRKFIFHFTNAAAGCLRPEDIDEEYLKNAGFLHIMGCSLSAGAGMRAAILKAAGIAKQQGAQISFDPNIRPELLGSGEVKAVFDKVLALTDVLLTGESELLTLMQSANIAEAVAALKNPGISIIVLKNGAKGITLLTGGQRTFFPPFEVAEIDPTGAGDCFDGAFVACLAEGRHPGEAAFIANAAGALAVTRKGPMEGASFRKEIMDFITASGRTVERPYQS